MNVSSVSILKMHAAQSNIVKVCYPSDDICAIMLTIYFFTGGAAMNIEMCVNSLSMPLPEDILKRKWAGDLDGAVKAIDMRLENEMPDMLRARLVCEKERIRRLPTQYPWNRAQALQKLRELIHVDVTEEEFDRLELSGWVDFIYLNGEKRYFVRFHRSMLKNGMLAHLTGEKPKKENAYLDEMIAEIREKGELKRRITLRTSVYVDEEAFVPGAYLAHLPFPIEDAQQGDVRLLAGDPDGLGDPCAPQRTAWWKRDLNQWRKFEATYSYVSHIRYADPLNQPAPAAPLYPCAEPTDEDLAESGAYLRFTPYLRALAHDLADGEETDVMKAWRIYEFITTKINYTFMRDYFQFDNHGEYCAVNLKGDCGLQALLMVILCRIAGIPARWQSGMSIDEDYIGGHDWMQFYLKGWGWVFADPSYGGGAYRAGNSVRHAFYFGNLDPMRLAANRVYQAEMEPKKAALRVDPFDNQSGELERAGAGLPFTMRQLDGDADLISFENL
ncbi:MAG: transglutaminase domain-containing protein [Clostridiales bacterium]|nr:transglutaminase domain-containing protein [Clostridiales bacterium]